MLTRPVPVARRTAFAAARVLAFLTFVALFTAGPVAAQLPGGFGDDLRLTEVGGSGSTSGIAQTPEVAFDPIREHYLVVWAGDDTTAGLAVGEHEILAQILSASGEIVSTVYPVSQVSPAGDPLRDASDPAVAYDAAEGTFIVVWAADDATTGGDQRTEIFARIVAWDPMTGLWSASNVRRVSEVQTGVETDREARYPAVAWAAATGEALVVWMADDPAGGGVDNKYEIYGRRIDDEAAPLGNVVKLSSTGRFSDANADAVTPRVSYHPVDELFQIVWHADPITEESWVDGHSEIYGRQILAATGDFIGTQARLTLILPTTDPSLGSFSPDLVWDGTTNAHYLVFAAHPNEAWSGDYEREIYGRLLTDAGALAGPTRLSTMGPDGNPYADAGSPRVAWDPALQHLLVVWRGHETTNSEMGDPNDQEIWGRALSGSRFVPTLGPQLAISDMGGGAIEPAAFQAEDPAVAAPGANGRFLVVWRGNDDDPALDPEEIEVWGDLVVAGSELLVDGFESGTTNAWPEAP